MAAPLANTFLTTDAVANREDLSDVVDLTSRQETPLYSLLAKTTAKSTAPEWLTEEIDPPGDNAVPEGREFDYQAISVPDRYQNHTQIFEKTGAVSRTQEAVDNAGNAEKFARAKILKGIAMKRDVEYSLLANNPSVPGETRKSGSLSTWAETNVNRGTGGANGGFNPTTRLTEAPTNATALRELTRPMINDILRQGFESGANLKNAFVTPGHKEVFATFMSDANVAQLRMNVSGTRGVTLISDVEMYRGPNGMINIIPNYVMSISPVTSRNIFILDTSKLAWAWLRKIQEVPDLANTGDKKPFVIQGEGTLKVANEKAVGVIADLFDGFAA